MSKSRKYGGGIFGIEISNRVFCRNKIMRNNMRPLFTFQLSVSRSTAGDDPSIINAQRVLIAHDLINRERPEKKRPSC